MKKALVIGGANGVGLAVALEMAKYCQEVFIVDKRPPRINITKNINYVNHDLLLTDYDWIDQYLDVDALFYSAGFGRVARFEQLKDAEIVNSFKVNSIAAFIVLHRFMPRLQSSNPFYCGVMVSIAARIASPLFSVYSATKASLFRGIEAVNAELRKNGTENRILEISPGSIKGTSFMGNNATDLSALEPLATKIVVAMRNHSCLLIPEYKTVYKDVVARYNSDSKTFADESYDYKYNNGRIQGKPQITIGYLSGTFDLFHIGHLNMLRNARQHCDYLVVGVHRDASHKGKETFIPFEERFEILKSIRYVDKVIESEREDSDVYVKGIVKYDKLFVGSDYKGSERFNRYEEYFKDKGVEIIYFPYTKGTSSTQLREALVKNK